LIVGKQEKEIGKAGLRPNGRGFWCAGGEIPPYAHHAGSNSGDFQKPSAIHACLLARRN
jgi:hypothetical protein